MSFIKWSEFRSSITTNNYMKSPITATYLYVISQNTMTTAERAMIATLQGLVNKQSSIQIYTLNSDRKSVV